MPPKGDETVRPAEDIALAIQGIELTPKTHPDRAARLGSLSQQYLKLFERGGDPESLKHALSFANDAVEATCDNIAQKSELLYNRSRIAWLQYREASQRQRLDEAIADADEALKLVPISTLKEYNSDAEQINLAAHLSTLLFKRYESVKSLEDLETAIQLAKRVVDNTAQGNPARPSRLSSLSEMLFHRYQRTSEADDLLEAISGAEASLSLTALSDTKRPSRLSSLGVMLLSEFYLTGQVETLESGVARAQEAVESVSEDDPTYIGVLNNSVIILTTQHTYTGNVKFINNAISLARKAANRKKSAILLNNLGTALISRYESTGNVKDLEDAISTTYEAIRTTPDNHVDLPARLGNISNMVLRKYERTKAEKDLEDAVSYAREAVNKTPEGSHSMAGRLSNLSKILSKQYERIGSWSTLEEAIALARRSFDLTHASYMEPVDRKANIVTTHKPDEHFIRNYYPDLASRLSNLSSLLFIKHIRTGKVKDLNEAILHLREGLELIMKSHADYATMLNNLGAMLLTRYEKWKTYKDLEDAVQIGDEVIHKTHEHHPDKSGRFSNSSHIIFARYMAKDKSDRKDLEEAIRLAKVADNALPSDNYLEKTNMRGYIGKLLWEKYLLKEPGSKKDLDNAIEYTNEVIKGEKMAASALRDLPNMLSWLGAMLLERYDLAGADQDLEDAIRHTREAIRRTVPDVENHLIPMPLARVNSLSRSTLLQSTVALLQGSPVGKRDESEDCAPYFKNLSTMLSRRFKKDSREEDLNEAIYFARKAMRATPDQHPELPDRLRDLGDLLMERYNLTGQQKDLDECGAVAGKLDSVLHKQNKSKKKRVYLILTDLSPFLACLTDLAGFRT
ncbi:hypothetical protein EKO27_g11161 [Xylaria grammica]|uniref:Uncharacterized protein n=1 Tax=Xylaria grammica TaxID=363999 RepID=A0A439CP64_9PEZI|nr:hypothetical protein EKO27_g11161 [Xylaria grammica]